MLKNKNIFEDYDYVKRNTPDLHEMIHQNIKWLGQLLAEDGVKGLETFFQTEVNQGDKDEVADLITTLADYSRTKSLLSPSGEPVEWENRIEGGVYRIYPQLRLVKDHDEDELSTTD